MARTLTREQMSRLTHIASDAYWYAIGTGRIQYEHRASTDEYTRFCRCMNGMPTDADVAALEEWAAHMPTDVEEVAHRAWARR